MFQKEVSSVAIDSSDGTSLEMICLESGTSLDVYFGRLGEVLKATMDIAYDLPRLQKEEEAFSQTRKALKG